MRDGGERGRQEGGWKNRAKEEENKVKGQASGGGGEVNGWKWMRREEQGGGSSGVRGGG